MRAALLFATLMTLTAHAESLPPAFRNVHLGSLHFDTPLVETKTATLTKGWLPGIAFAAASGPSAVTIGASRRLGRYADLSWNTSRYATAERYAPLANRATQDWAAAVKLEFRF